MKVIFDFDYSIEVVDKKLYDKLEAKHEADCRLISEYDLEIKKLKKQNEEQNETVNYIYSNLCTEQKEHLRCEAVIKDLKFDVEKAKSWEKRYKELEYIYEKKNEEHSRLEDKYERQGAVLKKKYDEIDTLNKQIDSFGLTCRLYEKETKDLKADVERWVERHNRLRDMDKKRLFDYKNVENERDHYKGLYSSKCDDYDNLLAKQIKTEKELYHAEEVGDNYKLLYDTTCDNYDKLKEQKDNYKNLFHSLNHKHQKVVGEMKRWKERAMTSEQKLKETEEKLNDARIHNKMRDDVFEANIKLQKTIEAKDREINLLRAELDKYKTDECDDRWID